MTVVYESQRAFHFGAQATILNDDAEMAWAEKHVIHNPAYKWVVGKFVEADNANSNRQYFSLEGLRVAQPSIAHAPMNVNHAPRRIVGAYVATELVYPMEGAAEGAAANPFIDALGVFWRHYFPEEYAVVEMAHKTGSLFFSMECIPEKLMCDGENGCKQEFAYEGRFSPSYCAHLNHPESGVVKHLINPHFTGGALIVPPEKPGWKNATIQQLSTLVKDNADELEMAYEGIKQEAPELSPKMWEALMAELVGLASKKI